MNGQALRERPAGKLVYTPGGNAEAQEASTYEHYPTIGIKRFCTSGFMIPAIPGCGWFAGRSVVRGSVIVLDLPLELSRLHIMSYERSHVIYKYTCHLNLVVFSRRH
jgi:hypothetical protein